MGKNISYNEIKRTIDGYLVAMFAERFLPRDAVLYDKMIFSLKQDNFMRIEEYCNKSIFYRKIFAFV